VVTRIKVTVDASGPLFDGRAPLVMRRFFNDASWEVAKSGRDELKSRAMRQPRHPTGGFSGAITINSFRKGRTILAKYPEVLYGPWLEGTSQKNQSTRFKGYRMFRLTLSRLRKRLTPLIQDRLNQAIRELGG
jgi:hypothetical protein